jgi:Uma2 family endonuclease
MHDPLHKYTLDEYWHIAESVPEQKYEYIDGNIRLMTGGSPAHAQIAARIAGILDRALYETDCNVYVSDAAVQLSYSLVYYPDVTVSCDPADWTRKKALESPTVIVEVHSPSTEKTDRREKLLAYQHYPTIQEIVFVDSRKRRIEHYHRIGISEWQNTLYTENSDIIDLQSLDVSLSVGQIYHKVYLELEEK